ncbi:hypothetical protein EC988_003405 [Linderina pennispora]|nr:hypothetical protein EC988_003405 [Linderina pennispora]
MTDIREYIDSPLDVINRLFESHKASVDGSGHTAAAEIGKVVQADFQDMFKTHESLGQIPLVNGSWSGVKPQTLVRFQCMVQDPGYGEELHLSLAQVSKDGEKMHKFSHYTDRNHELGEGWEIDYSSPHNVFTEKEVAYCVSVPGQRNGVDDAMQMLSVGGLKSVGEKYPLKGEPHVAALVKFYAPAHAPRASRLVDVVGVYEPGFNSKTEDYQGEWPCIHAIFYTEGLDTESAELSAKEFEQGRDLALSHLTAVLGGDQLAAQFLLLHLLSCTANVQGAKVGKYSLNLIGFPSQASEGSGRFALRNSSTRRIADALEQLLPRVVELPFDLKLLNGAVFVPSAESGDLHSGVLQLPPGTEIICDETCLDEGTLGERGVKNLHALQTVIMDQSVSFQYPYQPVPMDTDVRVLVLSAGKSILHNDCDVYLSSELCSLLAKAQDEPPVVLDPLHRDQIRQYLASARNLEFRVPQAVSEKISEEYAESRKQAHATGAKMMTQTELSGVITVARLVSIAKGEAELTMESWGEANELEQARVARNSQAKPASKEPAR